MPLNTTTLRKEPSVYDMVLFIADKLSWDQNGRPPYFESVLHGLDISLEQACLNYMKYVVENGMVLYPHSWFLEGKSYLEGILK